MRSRRHVRTVTRPSSGCPRSRPSIIGGLSRAHTRKPLASVVTSGIRRSTRARQRCASAATRPTTTATRSRDTMHSQLCAKTVIRTTSGFRHSSITLGRSKAHTRKPLALAVTPETRRSTKAPQPFASTATRAITTAVRTLDTQTSRRPAGTATARTLGVLRQVATILRMPSRSNRERTRSTATTARPATARSSDHRLGARTPIALVVTTATTREPRWMTSTAGSPNIRTVLRLRTFVWTATPTGETSDRATPGPRIAPPSVLLSRRRRGLGRLLCQALEHTVLITY